jgi:hypothetical protein
MSSMTNEKWDLYVGFPANLTQETKQSVIDVINMRHPDCTLQAVLEGYWGDVSEDTLQIQFKSELKDAQTTVKIIQAVVENSFVALCEAEI